MIGLLLEQIRSPWPQAEIYSQHNQQRLTPKHRILTVEFSSFHVFSDSLSQTIALKVSSRLCSIDFCSFLPLPLLRDVSR
jgi:hypothetical protein